MIPGVPARIPDTATRNYGPELADGVALLESKDVELLEGSELLDGVALAESELLDGVVLLDDVLFDPAAPGTSVSKRQALISTAQPRKCLLVHPFTQRWPSAEGPT